MRFERIRSGEDPRYGEAMALYQRSFPLFEQRYPQVQLAVMPQEEYHFTLLYEGEDFAGCSSTGKRTASAMSSTCAHRIDAGQMLRQPALAFLRKKGKKMILEIDPPVDPVSQRRQPVL